MLEINKYVTWDAGITRGRMTPPLSQGDCGMVHSMIGRYGGGGKVGWDFSRLEQTTARLAVVTAGWARPPFFFRRALRGRARPRTTSLQDALLNLGSRARAVSANESGVPLVCPGLPPEVSPRHNRKPSSLIPSDP